MASSVMQLCSALDVDNFSPDAVSLNSKLLKPLDEVLRCHICFEYFTNCMITKCSHNYCSLCIRRYMAYKSQCPTCFKAASEPELQNNRLIDEILQIYKKLREALQISPESLEKTNYNQPSSSKEDNSHDTKLSNLDSSTCVENNKSKEQIGGESASSNMVSCPVCYNSVPSKEINFHLDKCLKQSKESAERKYLPKLVYHLLKDKQIKEKLKEHGLSTSGDRKTLIRRLKNFVLLYNANCDSLNPKPVVELIVEIDRQEVEERLLAAPKNTDVGKRSDPSVIEKQNENYVQEHKSQFTALLQDAQQRELSRIIKKEETPEVSMTSCIVDHDGKQIGEASLQIKNAHFETVTVKQEFSDSLPSTETPSETSEEEVEVKQELTLTNEKSITSKEPSKKSLPFRIKKRVPIKLKRDLSLLDRSDEDSSSSSESSQENFSVSQMQPNACLKKKNARKLSVGDGNGGQRKK